MEEALRSGAGPSSLGRLGYGFAMIVWRGRIGNTPDVRLKRARLARLGAGFSFHQLDIADHAAVLRLGAGVEVVVQHVERENWPK